MNKELCSRRLETYRKYHIQGMPNYARPKINAINISSANTKEHEMKKCEICYDLKSAGNNFITEAVDNKTNLRRDVVCLDDGRVYEVETNIDRAIRFLDDKNVIIVPVGWYKEDNKWKDLIKKTKRF